MFKNKKNITEGEKRKRKKERIMQQLVFQKIG